MRHIDPVPAGQKKKGGGRSGGILILSFIMINCKCVYHECVHTSRSGGNYRAAALRLAPFSGMSLFA